MRHTSRIIPATAAATILAFTAGCTSASTGTDTTSPSAANTLKVTVDQSLSQIVPQKFRTNGVRVATDATYPPFEVMGTDNKTIEGADIDIMNNIGKLLNVKVTFINTSFDEIVPGMAANKFDVAISGIADHAARRAHIDFVDYANNGGAFLVKSAYKGKYPTWASACGTTVAVQSATTMADDADVASKQCKAAGKSAITVSGYKTQSQVVLAVQSGRATIGISTGGSAATIVKQTGSMLVASTPPDEATKPGALGIAVQNSSPELVKAIQAALKKLIADGGYDNIMKKWGLFECCSNRTAEINGGVG